MPSIIYSGPYREVEFQGVICKHGEAVVFPAEITKRALEQDCWTKPKPTPRKKGA